MSATLFEGLPAKLKAQWKAGLASKEIVFTESDVDELDDYGIPFEVRFAPLLAKKPSLDPSKDPKAPPKDGAKDPFMPPYVPELFVAEDTVKEEGDEEGDDFVVLLNKFSLVPRHFLLCTKEFVPQASPITPTELLAAYSILKQLGSREKHLCFYNSGPESGASQPHKHLQFVPLSNGMAPFDAIIDEHKPENTSLPFQLPLPYANFTILLPGPRPGRSLSGYLFANFFSLLDLMIDHVRRLAYGPDSPYADFKISSMSYNFVMTEKWMMLVPRVKESWELESGEKVSINGMGFAGFLLTKTEEAFEGVKKEGVVEVLSKLGYPSVAPGEAPEAEII